MVETRRGSTALETAGSHGPPVTLFRASCRAPGLPGSAMPPEVRTPLPVPRLLQKARRTLVCRLHLPRPFVMTPRLLSVSMLAPWFMVDGTFRTERGDPRWGWSSSWSKARLVPVDTTADGNCLFHALSLGTCGDESISRVRTSVRGWHSVRHLPFVIDDPWKAGKGVALSLASRRHPCLSSQGAQHARGESVVALDARARLREHLHRHVRCDPRNEWWYRPVGQTGSGLEGTRAGPTPYVLCQEGPSLAPRA